MTDNMTPEELDRMENSIVGAGMLWAVLAQWRTESAGGTGVTVELVLDENEYATNALLVKFDIGGPPKERGYIVTVTIPKATDE